MKQPTKKTSIESEKKTSVEQIRLYGTISPLLHSAFNEIKELSKRKQDEELKLKKVQIINRLLGKAKEVLKNEPTVEFLDLLDEDELPSNSDAVLIMSQYISAMNKFHSDHYHSQDWEIGIKGEWD